MCRDVEPRGLFGELCLQADSSASRASPEPSGSPDDRGNEIFGILFGVLLKLKLNTRELWRRAWSTAGPALEQGEKLSPEHSTPRVETGSDETYATLVTPDLDTWPKLKTEAKLRTGIRSSCCGFCAGRSHFCSAMECKGDGTAGWHRNVSLAPGFQTLD